MKKILFSVLFFMIICLSFGQSSTMKKVAKKNKAQIAQLVKLNSSMDSVINDKFFCFAAQNEEYEHIIDNFAIVSGEAQEVYDTLLKIKKFISNCNGKYKISSKIGDIDLYHCNILGATTKITVYGKYVYIKDSHFDFFIDKLLDFCKKNNIEIKK